MKSIIQILTLFCLMIFTIGISQDRDQLLVAKGFTVEIAGYGQLPLESYSVTDSLKPKKEPVNSKSQTSKFGFTFLDKLTLTTFVSAKQNILGQIEQNYLKGKNERYSITIYEMAKDKFVIKTFIYGDCMFLGKSRSESNVKSRNSLIEKSNWKPAYLKIIDPIKKEIQVIDLVKETGEITKLNEINLALAEVKRNVAGQIIDIKNSITPDVSKAQRKKDKADKKQKKNEAKILKAQTSSDQLIFSKYFKFEVKGIYNEVPGVTSVSGGELTINVEESTRGDRPDYREYTYGSHEYADLTFTVQTGPGMTKLQEWADKAMKLGGSGNALRRDCSLYLLARDKTTVMRTINYFGCYPTSVNAGDHSTSSEVKEITFTCDVDRIEETKG